MSVNKITQRIHMSNGLSLYKTGRSPYYFVRIWNPIKKKYLTRSTKETTRIDARQVAQELFSKLHTTKFKKTPSNKTFNHFANLLMKQQESITDSICPNHMNHENYFHKIITPYWKLYRNKTLV